MSIRVLALVKVSGNEKREWIELPCYGIDAILDELLGFEEEEILDDDGNGTGEFEETDIRKEGTVEFIDAECDEECGDSPVISLLFKRNLNLELEELEEMADFFDSLRSHQQNVFMALCDVINDWEEAESAFRSGDYSYYKVDSYEELGRNYYFDVYGGNDLKGTGLENFIDWEAFGESLEYEDTAYGFIQLFY